MSDELPEGWASVNLADAVEPNALIQYGILQPGPDTAGGIPYVRPTEIVNDTINVAAIRRTTKEIASQYVRSALLPGDVILSIVGSIGKVAIVPKSLLGANITQSSARLRPRRNLVEGEYLAWFLRSPTARAQYQEAELGTGVPRLNIGDIRRMTIALAPLVEQRRIVAKVDALLAQVNAARERLERVPLLLKRFRQSVLAAACSGALTEDWRRQEGKDVIPVSLDGLLESRRHAWEQSEIVKASRRGRVTTPQELQRRYKSPLTAEEAFDVPDTWAWASLDAITLIAGGVTKGQKRGPGAQVRSVAYLRVANVQRGRLDLKEIKRIDATEDEIAELELQAGDLLLNEGGDIDKLGRGWVWNGEIPNCIHQNHVFRARPASGMIEPRFVSHYANTFGQKFFFDAGAQTVNLASVSMSKLRALPVPCPPIEEQREIMRRVNGLLALGDSVEAQVRVAMSQAKRIAPTILERAFAGELVATESEIARRDGRDFESAEALLRRAMTSTTAATSPMREGSPAKRRGRPPKAAVGT